MRHAARTMAIHEAWAEARVAFPQGLPTPGRLTDPEGRKPGWQREAGDQGDRDLKLVDAILASLRAEGCVDERRVYATGHSNGGSFTYLLWAERETTFAAFAPSAAVLARGAGKLVTRPVLHLGSPDDPLVKWTWQSRLIDHLLSVNGCGPRRPDAPGLVIYEPRTPAGAPVGVYIHAGGHGYPPAGPEVIAAFFRARTAP
ncbi:MAG: prolyl oligopeptidase family serine peptidase [Opitutaceae bacterium]|nr:prolyl oligopeptidase family serine peptidase [Opitutaceae bacterium]